MSKVTFKLAKNLASYTAYIENNAMFITPDREYTVNYTPEIDALEARNIIVVTSRHDEVDPDAELTEIVNPDAVLTTFTKEIGTTAKGKKEGKKTATTVEASPYEEYDVVN
jgi:hypothetical protein